MSVEPSLKRAVELGIIPGLVFRPTFTGWKPPGISPQIGVLADTIPRSPSIVPFPPEQQWLDPARDTTAQLYQDKGFSHAAPFTDGEAYEIARFQAGPDDVGVVKYIGTFVEILSGGSPVQLDFSNPYTMQDNGVDARFILRLQQGITQTFSTSPWTGPVEFSGGYGYGQLPHWNDYRFYWGRYANNVRFLVPRRHALRLYIHVVSGAANLNRTLGRLQGFTQAAATLPAAYNVTHGW